MLIEVLVPGRELIERARAQREVVDDADADRALLHVRVFHESHDRARRGLGVAEVEVARSRIVLVLGALDQRHAQQVAVEADRAIEV